MVPDDPTDEGGYVQTTVIEDGERRLFVLVLVGPADPGLLAEARSAAATLRFA